MSVTLNPSAVDPRICAAATRRSARRVKGASGLPFVCNKKRPRGLLDCWIRNVSGLLEVLPDLRSVCLLAVLEDTLPLELVA